MKEQDFQFDTMIADQWGFLTRERRSGRQYVEDLGNGVLLEMVAIPGGTFLMGSPATEPDHTAHESPQHEVTIAPFSIGKHPVTQQQWMALMNANPSAFKGQRCPVESLAWFEADDFCRR